MKKIAVTCAIIVKNDTLLACQRGPGSEHPYEWEFPEEKSKAQKPRKNALSVRFGKNYRLRLRF